MRKNYLNVNILVLRFILKFNILFETEFKPRGAFVDREYTFRQHADGPQPFYFVGFRDEKAFLCQIKHSPFTENIREICEIPAEYVPSNGGHLVPYISREYGPLFRILQYSKFIIEIHLR